MTENYSAMRKEDLIARQNQLESEISALNNKQMAFKIRLNSCYGAL